ncbi:hypothetical protein [Coleofasciculus sp. FACHB-129]|nr:hypothetical protein [Coleofasciculus sp. FACHB-129]
MKNGTKREYVLKPTGVGNFLKTSRERSRNAGELAEETGAD